MRRPSLLLTGAAAAALGLTLLLSACGGDDEPLTVEQAETIVQAGLLTVEDLPSVNWTVTEGATVSEDEEGISSDDMFGDTEACRDLEAAILEVTGQSAEGQEEIPPLAEASRSFEFGGDQTLVARSVESGVAVPEDRSSIDDAFDLLREVFTADHVRPCFESSFQESMGGEDVGVVISRFEVTEPARVKPEGVALALDLEAVAFIIPINMHMQMHFWPEGPAVGQLFLIELNSDTLATGSEAILENARKRLADAVAANR